MSNGPLKTHDSNMNVNKVDDVQGNSTTEIMVNQLKVAAMLKRGMVSQNGGPAIQLQESSTAQKSNREMQLGMHSEGASTRLMQSERKEEMSPAGSNLK